MLRFRSLVRRFLAPVCRVVSTRRAQECSVSKSCSRFQKMRCGPSQTNLAALQCFVPSGLINLLVVRLAISVQPSYPTHRNQGPQRAGTAVPDLNCFPLRPVAFPYMRPQGFGGNTVSGLTGERALFLSDLRVLEVLLFFAAIAILLCISAAQEDSAIHRPNVSSPAKAANRRCNWTYGTDPQIAAGLRYLAGAESFNACWIFQYSLLLG
jgi:hypothetical protein